MKSVIFSVFLLFLLPVVLADKNTCYSCNATNSHTCKHEEEECPEGNECMIISEEIIIQGKSCHSLTKRCALNLPCNQTFYGNVGLDIIIKVSHRCCEGKLCNTDPFEPPSIPTKGKGIKCPSCFLYNNTGDCTATQSTICSGKEDQCMEFRGSMKLPFLADKNRCYSCNATNSHTCKHEEEECPEGNECMIVSEEFISLGKSCHSLTKRCALNLPCNQTFYGNVGLDIVVKVSHRCCKGKLCNTGFFEPPSIPTKGKGMKCPSCFSFNTTEGCTATQSTICSGKDDQCIQFRGSIKLPCGGNADNYSGQGCGSKGLCEYGASLFVGVSVTNQLEIKCF